MQSENLTISEFCRSLRLWLRNVTVSQEDAVLLSTIAGRRIGRSRWLWSFYGLNENADQEQLGPIWEQVGTQDQSLETTKTTGEKSMKLSVYLKQCENTVIFRILAQIGDFKENGNVKILQIPELQHEVIFLRGGNQKGDHLTSSIYFDDIPAARAFKEEVISNLSKYMRSQQPLIESAIYGQDIEISDDKENWYPRTFIASLPTDDPIIASCDDDLEDMNEWDKWKFMRERAEGIEYHGDRVSNIFTWEWKK